MLNKSNSSKTSQILVSNAIERYVWSDVGKQGNQTMDLYRNNHKRLSEMTIFKRILELTGSCFSQRLAALSLVLTFLLVLPLIAGFSTPYS